MTEDLKVEKTGLKEDFYKVSYQEISPYFLEEMAYRLTKNKEKYPKFNWLQGQDPEKILDALERHTQQLKHFFWKEKRNAILPLNLSTDSESSKETPDEHCAAIAINAMILFHTIKS